MSSIPSLRGASPQPFVDHETPQTNDSAPRTPFQRAALAARQPKKPVADLPDPLPQQRISPAGLGSDAFEEITFAASEREEAEFHDELHDQHVQEAERVEGNLPVEKVMAVMRLMEGRTGYPAMMQRARQFAKDFVRDREGALERLKPESYRPEVRYALFNMAEDLLRRAEHHPEQAEALTALRALESADADQIGLLVKIHETAVSQEAGTVTGPNSQLLQYLSSPLSARVLMDAIGTQEGLKALSKQVHRLPDEGHFDQPAAFVGLSVSLAHMMAVIRTMDEHVSGLTKALKLPASENGRLLRSLMDMCRTAAPKPKLEKLRSDVLKVVGASNSLRFDHELLNQVSKYPESVWISTDAKTAVQQWLREAQGLHYRRKGVLDITGQWQKEALRPTTTS